MDPFLYHSTHKKNTGNAKSTFPAFFFQKLIFSVQSQLGDTDPLLRCK